MEEAVKILRWSNPFQPEGKGTYLKLALLWNPLLALFFVPLFGGFKDFGSRFALSLLFGTTVSTLVAILVALARRLGRPGRFHLLAVAFLGVVPGILAASWMAGRAAKLLGFSWTAPSPQDFTSAITISWLVFTLFILADLWRRSREARQEAEQRIRLLEMEGGPARAAAQPASGKTHLSLGHFAHPSFAVRSGARLVMCDPAKIPAILAKGDYSAILLEGGECLANESLDFFGKRLARAGFVRAHRSALINLAYLKALERAGGRKYRALLSDPLQTRVPVSRDRLAELKARLGLS